MLNVPDIYPEEGPVDQTSYCILLRLRETDRPLWKRELTRKLNEWRSSGRCPLNIEDEVNVQTISRRVDDLVDRGLVDVTPVYPERLERYVQGFELTDEAEQTLEEVSDRIIHNLAVTYIDHAFRSEELVLMEGMIDRLAANTTVPVEASSVEGLEEEIRGRINELETGRLAVRG
ncbi:MAG: hypothetical protein SV186_00430 [Candidatus Nanohaloarchaea archaeon]|nr:hypothetical protein [Candidatus Nanohaloarchaea archaeon]